MYDAVIPILVEMDLHLMELVGFAYDGEFSLRDIHEGLYTKLCYDPPHLLTIHCIAHREAIVQNVVSSHFLEFLYFDKFAN